MLGFIFLLPDFDILAILDNFWKISRIFKMKSLRLSRFCWLKWLYFINQQTFTMNYQFVKHLTRQNLKAQTLAFIYQHILSYRLINCSGIKSFFIRIVNFKTRYKSYYTKIVKAINVGNAHIKTRWVLLTILE